MDDPDPSFTARFEPEELLRQRCARCHEAVAALECKACVQAFCANCERHVHDAQRHPHLRDPVKRERSSTELEDEESKGNGGIDDQQRVHQAHVVAINLCQVCAQKSVDFLCVDCQTYQCEACCAARHLHAENFTAHLYFCVEGSKSNLIRYAQWSPEFLEMAKMSRRMRLQALEDERATAVKLEAAATAALLPSATAAPPVQRAGDTSGVPNIKMERDLANTATAEPIRDMQALSINEQQSAAPQMPPPATQQSAPAPATLHTPSAAFVKPEPARTPSIPQPAQLPPTVTAPPAQVEAEVPPSARVKVEQRPPVVQPPQPTIPPVSSNNNHVVDLTEDDEEQDTGGLAAGIRNVKREQFSSSLIFGNPRSVPAPSAHSEPAIKRESSAWLAAATASVSAGSATDGASGDAATHNGNDNDDDVFSLTDGDPIMRTMISEYNRLSEVIFNHEQEVAAIQRQLKDILANQSADMNEVVRISNSAGQVKNSVVKETHNRNAVVARLVVYLKQDPLELKTLLDESTDIPHMQTASHRRCAQLEAQIREKRYAIRKLKRSMEDAINMKSSDAFAEVSRLGAMIVADEQVVKESEEDRLVEFIRLVQFSNQIRSAARKMVNSSSSSRAP